MANRTWLGRAKARAQVVTLTPGGTIEVGDIFSVTINGKTVSYSASGTSVASVTAGLAAALQAAGDAEFAEVAWTDSTTHVTGTGATAGVPFTLSVETTESDGGTADDQTFTLATATEATGPHHADDAQNWSGAALPADGDSLYFANSSVSVKYGLTGLASVTPAAIDIAASYTGEIGLPKTKPSGYPEYRADYLQFDGATLVRIGTGQGQGSARIKLDFLSSAATVEVQSSGNSYEQGIPAILLKGATITLDVQSGYVGVGAYATETVTLSSLKTSAGANVLCGSGVTVTAFVGQGQVVTNGPVTAATVTGGTLTINGSAAPTTLTVKPGATCRYHSSGTVAALVAHGLVDCSGDSTARTFTSATLGPGGRIRDPQQTITYTNKIALDSQVKEVIAA